MELNGIGLNWIEVLWYWVLERYILLWRIILSITFCLACWTIQSHGWLHLSILTVSELIISLENVWDAFTYPSLSSKVGRVRIPVWAKQFSLCDVFLVLINFVRVFICELILYVKVPLTSIVVYIVESCWETNKHCHCCNLVFQHWFFTDSKITDLYFKNLSCQVMEIYTCFLRWLSTQK